nr:retrovirus-related Pol polyprotein from transposon TNT 1-94 [Tanacetum cinerariifolium]
SKDEEYAMAVRDFKKFFKRKGRFVRQPRNDKKIFQRSCDNKNGKTDRKCFRCGDPNHLIGECLKPPKDKNQRAFVRGSWSDSSEEDDEKVKNKTCLVAQASSEIITKNKRLKATRNTLENELKELIDKLSTIEKNNEVDLVCIKCQSLRIENEMLKKETLKLTKLEKSTQCLNEMLSNKKPSGDKLGLGFNSFEASSSGTKEIKFVKAQKKIFFGVDMEPDEWIKDSGCSKHITGYQKLFSTYKELNGGNVFFVAIFMVTSLEKTSPLVDDDLYEEEAIKVTEKKNLENDIMDETLEIDKIVNIKESRNHPLENVKGNLNQRTLRSQAQNQSNFFCFISTIEPKNVNEALGDESWIVFRNKLDENGVVSRNKARLVAQGYNQQEGVDYDETYASVARLESIRILLAYACALDFKLFQMDVKCTFLNDFINEEVYVAQPLGFIDFEKPDHVNKLKKALYGLKQAPKAWYDRLKAFLIKHEYKMGMVDNSLFTKKKSSNLIIVQKYVDGIIFGSTCQDMRDEFAKIMHDEFEMSMMGELNFFLGFTNKTNERR